MSETAACPMCGVRCGVDGQSLVQCPSCRAGLKVLRVGGAVSLVLSEYEPLAPVPMHSRSGAGPLFAAVLCLAGMGLWHVSRAPRAAPAVAPSVAPASPGGTAGPSMPGDAPASGAAVPGAAVPAVARASRGPVDPASPLMVPLLMPTFQGVLPAGRELSALFRIRQPAGTYYSWTGKPGQQVPGTSWTLRSASMQPPVAVIEMSGGQRIALRPGETYAGGPSAVPAPPTPEELGQVALAVRRRLTSGNVFNRKPGARRGAIGGGYADFDAPAGAGGTRTEAAPAAKPRPPNVSEVDASAAHMSEFRSYAVSGCETVVMVTSIRCGPCQRMKPKLEDWARAHPQSRAVLAEIGETSTGGINWQAPVVRANRIQGVPYLVILDTSGNVSRQGQDAHATLGF